MLSGGDKKKVLHILYQCEKKDRNHYINSSDLYMEIYPTDICNFLKGLKRLCDEGFIIGNIVDEDEYPVITNITITDKGRAFISANT